MFPIGEKVIVATCNGEFRGKVSGYSETFNKEKLYKVSGPKIVTITRQAEQDNGRELNTSIHCPRCDNPCCFKS